VANLVEIINKPIYKGAIMQIIDLTRDIMTIIIVIITMDINLDVSTIIIITTITKQIIGVTVTKTTAMTSMIMLNNQW